MPLFQFKTKILTPADKLLSPYIEKAREDVYYLFVRESDVPVKVGFLILAQGYPTKHYSNQEALRVTGIENLSHEKPLTQQYRKVGTALMEYVLAMSLRSCGGRITTDAIKDARMFFEKCGFQVNQSETLREFGERPESQRNMWCMYLPKKNIPVLQARFNPDLVLSDVKQYVLLDPTPKQISLIQQRKGKIVSEDRKRVTFCIDSECLKKDTNGGIRNSLQLFRSAVKKTSAIERKIKLLEKYLPEITIEATTAEKSDTYLLTGDQRFYEKVKELIEAKPEAVSVWEASVAVLGQLAWKAHCKVSDSLNDEKQQATVSLKAGQS